MMKKRICVLLLFALLLSGCAKDPTPTVPSTEATVPSTQATVPSTEATVPTTEATVPSTEVPTEAPTEAPTEPVYAFVNPLNGAGVEQLWTARPFAVMHNNISDAMPQVGISQADIHYEVLAEGGITRCLCIYSDISKAPTVGSIRSARTYYVELAKAYDAIYVHAGGSTSGEELIKTLGVNNISALTGYSSYFYRDENRLQTMAYEHTLMAKSSQLLAALDQKGYAKTRDEGIDYNLRFQNDATPDGSAAASVSVRFGENGKLTSFQYDPETRLYAASQYGTEYIDGETGEQITFTNVIALRCDTTTLEGGLLDIRLTGEGDGFFACGGKTVPIHWSRDSRTGNFTYTLADGSPLVLGRGRTYIAILPNSGTFTAE